MAKSKTRGIAGSIEEVVAAAMPNPHDEKKKADELSKKAVESFFSIGRPSASMRLLAYGETKVGKTNFLAHCAGIVILAIEEGANQYPVPQNQRPIRTLADYNEHLDFVQYGRHAYTALGIDTLDALELLVKTEIEDKLKAMAKTVKDGDAPQSLAELNEDWGTGYDLLVDAWRAIIARWDAIRDARGMHILLTAHEAQKREKTPDNPDFIHYSPTITGRKAGNLIRGYVDYIVRIAVERHVHHEKVRGVDKIHNELGKRFMHLTSTATHVAGCRGAVLWPHKLELDEQTGWGDFFHTRRLIETHKEALPRVLGDRMEAALGRVPKDGEFGKRAETGRAKFIQALGARDYYLCEKICATAERLAAEVEAATGVNQATGAIVAPSEAPTNGAEGPAVAAPAEIGGAS